MSAFRRPLLPRLLAPLSIAVLLGGIARASDAVEITVLDPTPGATVVRCELREFDSEPVLIGNETWVRLSIPGEGEIQLAGAPGLPRVCRSVVIPDDADVAVRVVGARHHDLPGVKVAPSRGPIPRTQDKAGVPYRFGPEYSAGGWFPSGAAALREPYILRDVRGVVLEFDVFQYDPLSQVLRVYDELVLALETSGPGTQNVLGRAGAPDRADRSFAAIYADHFVNYAPGGRNEPLNESGDMLIISYGPFMATMQPFVDWKSSIGIDTTIVDVATIGNNANAIKSFIQSVYGSSNLSYVLIVGDIGQVASGSYAGGLSDPFYSTMTPDWYPDLMVGRFSAQDTAQVATQVERSVEYEQMDHSLGAGGWNARAMGIASNQGPGHYGEYDNQHMDLIRDQLLGYGFGLVDRIYDPTATRAMIRDGLEDGRRLVDYCGHGSETSWGTTGWNNNDINALQNDNLLPFIHSVACVNGAFGSGTCFAEAWLRATNAGEPTGAVGAYMSSINQYWDEPMYAQDATIDRFTDELYWSMGALWFAGSCEMMDLCGNSGRDMFMTWICFGDPSLCVQGEAQCGTPATYCDLSPNSAGPGARIGYQGSTSISGADFTLVVADGVPHQPGLFYYGPEQASVPFGDGVRCVGAGGLGFFRLAVVQTDSGGNASHLVDYDQPPADSGPGAIEPGSLWNFQLWYRDPAAGGAGFNLSDALAAPFCP